MKKKIILIVMMFLGFISNAQSPKMDLTLSVKTATGAAMANTKVEFVETTSRERVFTTSDASGVARITLEGGNYWQIEILEIRDYYQWQLVMHSSSATSKVSMTITYNLANYLRETEPIVDRSKITFTEVKQNHSKTEVPKPGTNLLICNVKKLNGSPNSGVYIALVSTSEMVKYYTKTNSAGEAVFMLPSNSKYQLDLAQIENFSYFDTPSKAGMVGRKILTYEPTTVIEKNVNDTITQQLAVNQKGTSDRELATVKVIGGPDAGGVYAKAPVYLQELRSIIVYKAISNEQGVATFLVPKGKKYMIHFEYQKDVDVFDLTRSFGIGNSYKTRVYRPDPRLQFPESFIPSPEYLVIREFNNFLDKQFIHADSSKALGFNAYFGNEVNKFSRESVLNIEITSNPDVESYKTPPVNIAFVIDRSGSMAGYDRIETVKTALSTVVKSLRPEDKISIVVFETNSNIVLKAMVVGDNRNAILDVISRIQADGGTYIYPGLKCGFDEVGKFFKKNQTNRVVLLTDGYDSTPVDTLLNFVKAQKNKGIECSVVGVGSDYNVSLLQQIGDIGGGMISLVNNGNEINDAFAKELSSILKPVAKNIKVEVEYNKKIVYSQLYGPSLESKSDSKLSMNFRQMYVGLNDFAMIRFNLGEIDQSIENTPIIVRMKYYDLQKGQQIVIEKKVYLEWSAYTGELELQKEKYQKKLYAIALMNQALKVMSDASVVKDYPLAMKTIHETILNIDKTFPKAQDYDVDVLRKELQAYYEILSRIKLEK
jgi:hypothetical protein